VEISRCWPRRREFNKILCTLSHTFETSEFVTCVHSLALRFDEEKGEGYIQEELHRCGFQKFSRFV
jgi:hypothetical protein